LSVFPWLYVEQEDRLSAEWKDLTPKMAGIMHCIGDDGSLEEWQLSPLRVKLAQN